MSKKFKSQASSSRAATGAFGSFGGFSSSFGGDGREPSALTYIAEPPDLSRISDQQLVIAFKNLLKKDDITRTKALEELKEHVNSVYENKGTLDDGFLEAWVRQMLSNATIYLESKLTRSRSKYIRDLQLISLDE